MPKKCSPCLGAEVKQAIRQGVDGRQVQIVLESIPDCADPIGIEVCGKKGKARSAYQEFVGTCLKAKKLKKFDPEAMKECARQWRERKST